MKGFRDYIVKRESEITGVKPDATDLIKISEANHYFNSYLFEQLFPSRKTTLCKGCMGSGWAKGKHCKECIK